MPNEPDYKTAYETLARAIEEADRILCRADFLVTAELSQQMGEEIEKEVLDFVDELNSQP